jgi:uncharacterized membrane protein (UPF0127 family)
MKRTLILLGVLLLPLYGLAQNAPNPTLPTQKLTIIGHDGAKHDFTVEMALTPAQQETGLMFRREVPADHGMLFVWDEPREVPMWMKNTLVPLDMVFIGADGKVIHIAEDTVPQSLAQISSGGPVKATLEVQAGITEKLDIRVGDKVMGAGL